MEAVFDPAHTQKRGGAGWGELHTSPLETSFTSKISELEVSAVAVKKIPIEAVSFLAGRQRGGRTGVQ